MIKNMFFIFWEPELRNTLEDWVWGYGWKVILPFLTTLINGPEQDSYDRKYQKERKICKKKQCNGMDGLKCSISIHLVLWSAQAFLRGKCNVLNEQDKIFWYENIYFVEKSNLLESQNPLKTFKVD